MNKYLFTIVGLIFCSLFINDTVPSYLLSSDQDELETQYDIRGSVIYDVQINFSLHNFGRDTTYYFLNPKLDNHTPYQEVKLLYRKLSLADSYDPEYRDKYGNKYDQFNTTLLRNSTVEFDQHFEVELNKIEYSSITDTEIGDYSLSNEVIELYLSPEKFYDILDPDLISISNSIVALDDNPVEKARKIYEWVVGYLSYDEFDTFTSGGELGASWAYDNQIGDCSEFSSLMITLLRIQGIPARKVSGILVSTDPGFEPKVGDSWNFIWENSEGMNSYSSNFLSHAWVEYFLPNIGWIACDPTWGDGGYSYFNYQDFLRFGFNYGSWYPIPNTDRFTTELGDPIFTPYWSCYFNYQVTIEVISTNYSIKLDSGFVVIFITVAFLSVVLVYTILQNKREEKRVKVEETKDYILIK